MPRKIFITIIILLTALVMNAQTYSPDQPIPIDPKVRVAKLDNGLTYFIRENKKPENRGYIQLVVNAGSVLEDDEQLGLAHFVEHMAFNGTKNFRKDEIIQFMESTGMRFGPEVNAYTTYDQTVYMLELPMDSAGVFENGIKILRDWATNISFEDAEIDKERGVIIEEWRLRRGADARMSDKHAPVIFKNSKYALRNTIGDPEIIKNCDYETLRKFYRDWYRPELMAVVAVGDFNASDVEKTITEYFSDISPKENSRPREEFDVPDYDETRFSIASDKENPYTMVRIYFLNERKEFKYVKDYRQNMIERLFNMMLNERFTELTKQADPPFMNAFSGSYNLVRTKGTYSLSAIVRENQTERGLEALLTEAERVKQFGFTSPELERSVKNYTRMMEKQYNEKDKMESGSFASAYVNSYLNKRPVFGIEESHQMFNQFIGGISLEEVNALVKEFITESNRIITVNAPENETAIIPTEDILKEVFARTLGKTVHKYEENVSGEPLLSEQLQPSSITSENYIEELGVTELTLSNGVKVVLKPTDFKNDEIIMSASSLGGNSLFPEDKYYSSIASTAIVNESGLGNFSNIDLRKKLAGKIISVYPWISDLREGFEGTSSPDDIETMFQLVYMFFKSPRFDVDAYQSFKTRIKGYLKNRSASPDAAFQDTISVTMANYHYTSRPWSDELIEYMKLDEAKEVYLDRFADAGDFTFYFVGNLDLEKMKEFSKTHLGNLPSIERVETWKDINVRYPNGVIQKTVYNGIEPKSKVMMKFTGDFKWNPEDVYYMESLADYLDMRLREVIREDKSGTYGVGVWCSPTRYPHEDYEYSITFGCDPNRADELTNEILNQIDTLRSTPPEISYVNKIKEQHLRKRETDLKENSFWLSALHDLYVNGRDPRTLLKFNELVETITPATLQKTAEKYFNKNNYVRVVLLPENSSH